MGVGVGGCGCVGGVVGVWMWGVSGSIYVVPGSVQCRVGLIPKDMPAVTPTIRMTDGRQHWGQPYNMPICV